ncbi:hypothetical protein Tco_0428939 [Tanacetum coccineum]
MRNTVSYILFHCVACDNSCSGAFEILEVGTYMKSGCSALHDVARSYFCTMFMIVLSYTPCACWQLVLDQIVHVKPCVVVICMSWDLVQWTFGGGGAMGYHTAKIGHLIAACISGIVYLSLTVPLTDNSLKISKMLELNTGLNDYGSTDLVSRVDQEPCGYSLTPLSWKESLVGTPREYVVLVMDTEIVGVKESEMGRVGDCIRGRVDGGEDTGVYGTGAGIES